MDTSFYLSELLEVRHAGTRGRGVFALTQMPAGLLLETSPVIVMSAADRAHIDQTPLHDYIFIWGQAEDQCAMALGYIALYNHAPVSNCEYIMDYTNNTISVVTVREISAGEELFINYNGDWNDDRPVWFEQSLPG